VTQQEPLKTTRNAVLHVRPASTGKFVARLVINGIPNGTFRELTEEQIVPLAQHHQARIERSI
jgi:hypothetical protein